MTYMDIKDSKEINTQKIVARFGNYFNSPELFFGNFSDAWRKVSCQALKLETRQSYIERGNKSFEALDRGDIDGAMKLMEEDREADSQLYKSLHVRGVDFIRCRPVVYPLTAYLKWEAASYKINARYGEKIYISQYGSLYRTTALHDFMIFDRSIAFVHDYDEFGEIRGGWALESKLGIDSLIQIFGLIKAESKRFEHTSLFHDSY
jgi:hypothetical protein